MKLSRKIVIPMIALGCMFAFTACSKQTDQKLQKETTTQRTKDIKRPINTSQEKENPEVTIDQKQNKKQDASTQAKQNVTEATTTEVPIATKRMKRNLQRQKQSYITDLQMETALKFRKKMEVLK